MSGSISATTVMAGMSLALAAAGTAATVAGQMNQQASAGAQQSYLAAQARQNQMIANAQSADALQRGQVTEQRQRDITAQRIGTQQATLAGQGTDLGGSPQDILGDTARAGEQDALTIRSNAQREAWGYTVQGQNAGADAAFRGSFQPSYLGAGASLLSGASSLSDKWSRFKFNDPSTPGNTPGNLGAALSGETY